MKYLMLLMAALRKRLEGPVRIGTLEIGSHSVKARDSRGRRVLKLVHPACKDVARTGIISRDTCFAIRDAILGSGLAPTQVVLTGIFFIAANGPSFARWLEHALHVPCRVLSPAEDVDLLARAGRRLVLNGTCRAAVANLGGGTMEVAWIGPCAKAFGQYFALGADHLFWRYTKAGALAVEEMEGFVGKCLRAASMPHVTEIHFMGGTARSIAKLEGKPRLSLAEVQELQRRLRDDGSPRGVDQHRAPFLLPGVVVVRKTLESTGGGDFVYSKALEAGRSRALG